ELVASQHKAAALRSNVLHGGRPCGAMVGGWRAINLNTLRIHKGAQQWHVILPTDYRAQLAQRSIKYRQRRSVAISPDQPLRSGRHNFAMLAQQHSIRRKKK